MSRDRDPKLCRAALQSNPDGDDNPFRCGLEAGHYGAHVCECECGHTWGWSASIKLGTRVHHRQLGPRSIRVVERSAAYPNDPDLYDLVIAPDASDYSPGRRSTGAKDIGVKRILDKYEVIP